MLVDLTLIWAGVIAVGVFMYVLLDGFDLGIGILFPFAPDSEARGVMMNTVAPIWDGNETWLVLGGVGLLAAFPLAYSVLLPALYIPILLMLVALIFRGVAFEFRFKAQEESRWIWDVSFSGGSALCTFMQGVILGAFIQGFEVEGFTYVGGLFDWLTPFTIMTGLGLLSGYALIGVSWIIMKTMGDIQDWAFDIAKRLLPIVLGFIVIVSLWTPLTHGEIAARWFTWPNILLLSPVPIATALLAVAYWRSLGRRSDAVPFLCAIGLFLLSYLGLAISLWPYVVPPDISIWDAASSEDTQLFLLLGVLLVLPIILFYTAWTYWVFRGKLDRGSAEGYH